MTLAEIHDLIRVSRPQMSLKPRRNPDGWAVYLSPPRKGLRPNRLIRVVQAGMQSPLRLKRAISVRLHRAPDEEEFAGDGNVLLGIIDEEHRLYLRHFDNA